MHRLTMVSAVSALTTLGVAILASSLGCGGGGGSKPAENAGNASTASADSKESKTNESAGDSEGGENGEAGGPKKDECVGFDIANLDDLLMKSSCEVPNTRPDGVPSQELKGKVEVTLTASPTHVAPGGKTDLLVTFANKTKEPITLNFRIDPVARFETEAYDKKNKRADMPAGNPPSPPKGHSAPPASEPKVAHVTIAPNGSARQRVAWEAVKTQWAPEKVRGTPAERGFPRKPAGALPKGKYTVKVVTPLVGVTEGAEHETSSPKVEVEIGG